MVSKIIDIQIGAIFRAVEIPPDWLERMAKMVQAGSHGPSQQELARQRVRLARAYADGGFSDEEYEARVAEINKRIRESQTFGIPSLEDVVNLLRDLRQLWEEATQEERRNLLRPLIERVYVDLETKRIGAIVPASPFKALLRLAVSRSNSEVALLSEDEMQTECWSWWRRGRVELPVQRKFAQDILQAYPTT